MAKILAADIGGTNIRMAVVEDASIVAEYRQQLRFSRHRSDSDEQAQAYMIRVLVDAMLPFLETHAVKAVGIGFPGFFDRSGEVLLASPNLPQLKQVRLSDQLSQALGLPVVTQNDALCAAVGEWSCGAGQGCDDLLHVTLGTGVGGGVILQGVPFSGGHGMAMELGHLRTEDSPSARLCGCGGLGCVEMYASAQGLVQSFVHDGGDADAAAKQVFELAQQGDQVAVRAFELAGLHLGKALAHAVALLDVRAISFSGGLMGGWSLLQPCIQSSLDEHCIPILQGEVRLMSSILDDHAGLLGAAYLAEKNLAQKSLTQKV